MLKAIWKCVISAINDFSGWVGLLLAILALVLPMMGIASMSPAWFFGAAALAFFIRMVTIQWQLIKAQDSSRKPEPNISLKDVLIRMMGEKYTGANDTDMAELLKSFTFIREKALSGAIEGFGRRDWRSTRPAEMEFLAARFPIPKSHWENHRIDANSFFSDIRGQTWHLANLDNTETYLDIWFDDRQIDQIWPKRKMGLKERIHNFCMNFKEK